MSVTAPRPSRAPEQKTRNSAPQKAPPQNGGPESDAPGATSGVTPGGAVRRRSNAAPGRGQSLLDPAGIYGTRGEQRRHVSRRRRAVQWVTVLCGLVALAGAIALFPHLPRVGSQRGARVGLVQPPGASPVAVQSERGAALLVPTAGGDLLRFDMQSGTGRSVLDTAFPLRATPLVVKNVVFAPCEDGSLYVVDWHTGHSLWQHPTGAPLSARPALVGIPVKTPATLAVPHATMGPPTLQAASVQPSAMQPSAVQPSPAQPSPDAALKKLVVIGNDAGLVCALEVGTGRVAWQRWVGAPVGGGLVAVPGDTKHPPRILVPLLAGAGTRGGLWCLEARHGAPLWKFPRDVQTPSPQLAPPALDEAGGRVFCGDDNGALFCLRLRDGAKLWKTFVQPRQARSREAVLLRGEPLYQSDASGERVIVGGNDGLVRAFDAGAGRPLWSFDAGYAVRCRPLPLTFAGRPALLVGCDGPLLWLLDAYSGTPLRKLRTRDAASFGALPLDGSLFTITVGGTVEKFVF